MSDPLQLLQLAVTFEAFTDLEFWTGVGVIAGIYVVFALGLQLNVGFTGIQNFGQAGFMAIGAYTMAILTAEQGWNFWLSLPVAIAVTIVFGLIIGLPSLRLRADYFAIVTIAAAEAIRLVALNARELTNGAQGIFGFDDSWDSVSESIEEFIVDLGWTDVPAQFPLFLVTWGLAVLLMFSFSRIQRTPWGRVLRAVREDEDAARALGKNAFSYKLQSLALAATHRRPRRLLPRAQPEVRRPRRVPAAGHLHRLRGARPRRARELLGGGGRVDHPLDGARGTALPRAAAVGDEDRRAALHHPRPGADRADGVPPAGRLRQARGDGPR